MLRKIRITLATIFFVGITALFLDFTGALPAYLGWMAKVQFVPAILALNVSIIVILALLTLLFGRVYCSVICPLGVMQDIVSNLAARRKKARFSYSKAKNALRITMLVLFVVALVANAAMLAALIEPYSAYGRIVNNLFAPIYMWGNNLLAYFAEKADSYAFYSVDVWMKGIATFAISAVTFIAITILAAKNGRTWCNTICPVGTVLGALSRYSRRCVQNYQTAQRIETLCAVVHQTQHSTCRSKHDDIRGPGRGCAIICHKFWPFHYRDDNQFTQQRQSKSQ